MSALNTIQAPIQKEMHEFASFFKNYLKGNSVILNTIIKYLLKQKGKQIRPMLVFLSAKLVGDTNKNSYNAAALIELMHTATLVHDDVVDESDMRRGMLSINAVWKNKAAVLLGDYLLSRGLMLAVKEKEFALLETISSAVEQMSEGELIQIEKAKRLNIDEETYFDIIKKKTAALMVACTVSGALSAKADEHTVKQMALFGEYLGMAFQIRDDLFDYENNKIGKPVGNDIKERKITLPFIFALKNCSSSEKRHILKCMKKKYKTNKEVEEIILFVKQHKGIEYATNVMNDYKSKTLDILNGFADSDAKTSLLTLVNFIIGRNK